MAPDRDADGGFSENRRLIHWRLDRLDASMDELKDTVSRIEVDLGSLKTEMKIRAGIWGAISGAIPGLIGAAAYFLSKSHGGP